MNIEQYVKRIDKLRRCMEDRRSSCEAEHGKRIQALLRRWVVAAHDPAVAYGWMITICAWFQQRDDKIKIEIPLSCITETDERTLLEFEERRKAYKDEMDRTRLAEIDRREREAYEVLCRKFR